jgi:two-component system NtrC family sensor kinase
MNVTRITIRKKIMASLILLVMVWGVVSTAFFQHMLHDILVGEKLSDEVVKVIVRRFITIGSGLTIVGILIFHLVAAFFSRSISDPLKKLIDGVRRVGNGTLQGRIEVPNNDEIGELAETFNHMVEELRDTTVSKEHLNAIIESMINTIMVVGPDGTIQRVNNALLTLLGYNTEELIGEPATKVITEKKIADTLFNDLLQFSPICNVETFYNTRSGEKIPVSFSSSVIRDNDGGGSGIVCVAQDIIEQKIAEEKLGTSRLELMEKHQELEKLFVNVEQVKREWENTLDCVGDMVILTDQNGRIKRCNKPVLAIAHKEFEEIRDQHWHEVLFVEEIDYNACYDMGLELYHKPTDRWFELKHYPFREFGSEEITGMVITIHDSTEMKKVTEALEKAYVDLKVSQAKILQQEKMASIGLLAAGVAHEINNPVGFIKCNLGTLDQYLLTLNEFNAFQAEWLETLGDKRALADIARHRQELEIEHVAKDAQDLIMESLDGVERVRKIVQDLKSFSRLDEGEPLPANVNECISTALNIVWNELKYKASVKKEFGILPITMCFPQQLNQVFMNLLVNAAHAIERHGDITVRSWHRDNSIYVEISDTGRGIPEEQVQRIFEPFFTTKKVGEGTGLGLSISYDIVKKHDGDISVRSTIDTGTTFTVRLPVVEGAAHD